MSQAARRAPNSLLPLAAARLAGLNGPDLQVEGMRFLRNAREAGIDPSLIWCVQGDDGRVIASSLAAPSPGGAATVFLSPPPPAGSGVDGHRFAQALLGCLEAIIDQLPRIAAVKILQSLPEPIEMSTIRAFEQAGFERVANLVYLRAPVPCPASAMRHRHKPMPQLRLRSIKELGGIERNREKFMAMLNETYEQTLDCPSLCEVRDPADILASHLSVGSFDPGMWWVILDRAGEAKGCALLSPCPLEQTAELVYLGVSPSLRGSGAARWALASAIEAMPRDRHIEYIACAVDERNSPARAIYDEFGFASIGRRVAMIRAIHRNHSAASSA